MAKDIIVVPDFDDIVFKNRNKTYGAYRLRKKYHRSLLFAILVGTSIVVAVFLVQYFRATTLLKIEQRAEYEVIAQMEDLDQPDDLNVEPPPPPPPPEQTQQQLKYVAPEVVDTINPEDQVDLLTAAEAVEILQDEEVVEVEVVEEIVEAVEEYQAPEEVFIIVEEMPSYPGGTEALYEYIYSTIEYPPVALENQITGMVIVRFCVTFEGDVTQAEVLRGVDEATLDKEAIRVVESLPKWRPGKQAGQPVNVFYVVRIQFQIERN